MNSARRPLIAGNWKMHKGGAESIALAEQCAAFARHLPGVDVIIAPPFTSLAAVAGTIENSTVQLAAQNVYPAKEGAFTGEISAPMLRDSGCTWVLIGHSERRRIFGETDAFIAEKSAAALTFGLIPIVCVGETLAEREAGKTLAVVKTQLDAVLEILAQSAVAVALAYEPVWAIGTGKTAGPNEAEEVHAAMRAWLAEKSPSFAERTRLLYGGSVTPGTARALFACPNVDGALVGGASLDAASFGVIAGLAAQ